MLNSLPTLSVTQDTHTCIHGDAVGAAHPAVDDAVLVSDFELGPNDVLCGRGKRCQNNPGNVVFLSVCARYKPDYGATNKHDEKQRVVSDVVNHVRCALYPPGRFLVVADRDVAESRGHAGGLVMWRVAEEATALEKARRVLREKGSKAGASVGRKVGDAMRARRKKRPEPSPSKGVGEPGTTCDEQDIRPTHTPDIAALFQTSFAANLASVATCIGDGVAKAAATTVAKPAIIDEMPPSFTAQDELQEMATHSPMEIAKAEADLHGITFGLASLSIEQGAKEEERRSGQLYSLDAELAKIPIDRKLAYLQAIVQCPELTKDEHKIAFLEREDFSAKLAAERCVRYWETKLTFFGPEKCFLPLTLDGAMKGEMAGMVKHCPLQLLPVKDTAGRAIIFFHPSRRDPSKYSTDNVMMAAWYMIEAAAEDPEVRKNGFICLMCSSNTKRKRLDPLLPRGFRLIWDAVPVAYRSIHLCHPNNFASVLYPIIKYFIGRESRLRLKVHEGSKAEVLSQLESYCLPPDRLPSGLGGDVVWDLEKWLNDRLLLEILRKANQDEDFDAVFCAYTGGRATKRLRNDRKQFVWDERFPFADSSHLLSGDYIANTCDGPSVISAVATFQGETPPKCIGDGGVGHERRDSFFESIMKLHDTSIGATFQGETPNNCIGEEGIGHKRRDSFSESIAKLPDAMTGTSFQGEAPNNCIGEEIFGHERRDSFYESVMKLPDVIAGTLFPDKRNDHHLCNERRDSFYESIMKLPDAIAGTVFPDETPNIGNESFDHERRDSFFESTMELPAANTSNECSNITATGTIFQCEMTTECIDEGVVGHESDSFFEGMMELCDMEDVGTDKSRLDNGYAKPSIDGAHIQVDINKQDSKKLLA